ncbi:mediator of RNA polymerase II transcription subunit 31-like protein [Scenedesmus sp. NREL 46B-D3]|nr:mediator of RNA polymerase II transcription subunit 31-like protein [Scenedesmus sp. NREL 46B-D3]
MADNQDKLSRYLTQTGVNEHARFILELEFIQCLANPHYLNWLAQNKYLEDKAFLNYLKYLEYWRQPQYATYIRFPHCLAMLELLQSEHFRQVIASPVAMDEIHTQQAFYWMHYRTNRIKEAAAAAAAQAGQAEGRQAGSTNGQADTAAAPPAAATAAQQPPA